LVIAHRLSTVRNAERVIVLTEDGITEQGTHDDLIAQDGTYAKLYHVQARI
jgi:ATP-binding cassette subfamily B protein